MVLKNEKETKRWGESLFHDPNEKTEKKNRMSSPEQECKRGGGKNALI
jgi:hypothetical protein